MSEGMILVDEPNPWKVWNKFCQNCGRNHCCFFCQHEGCYAPMPAHRTLCARCGDLINTGEFNDPNNESMFVCVACGDHLINEVPL